MRGAASPNLHFWGAWVAKSSKIWYSRGGGEGGDWGRGRDWLSAMNLAGLACRWDRIYFTSFNLK